MRNVSDDITLDDEVITAEFRKIFMEYQPKLLYFINGFLKDMEASKDICQNIFFKIWQDRRRIFKMPSIESYLFYIAKGAVYNYFDHALVSNKYIDHILHSYVRTDDEEENLFAKELDERIRQIVSEMPEKRRKVFRLSRDKGLKNEEIAKQLNISKRTVENHLTAALAELRKELKVFIFIFFCV